MTLWWSEEEREYSCKASPNSLFWLFMHQIILSLFLITFKKCFVNSHLSLLSFYWINFVLMKALLVFFIFPLILHERGFSCIIRILVSRYICIPLVWKSLKKITIILGVINTLLYRLSFSSFKNLVAEKYFLN